MSAGKRAVHLATTFFFGSATSKVLVLALLPLYTRVLSPSEYGFFDLSVTYVTIVASVLFLDIWVGTMRFMYRSIDEAERGRAVKTGLLVFSVSSLLFVGAGVLTGALIPIQFLPLIIAYGLSLNLKEFYGCVARGYDQNLAFSASGAANTIVMVGLNLLLLLCLNWDLSALYVAAIVGNVLQIVWLELSTHAVRSIWRHSTSWSTTQELLRFALPLGVNSIAYWFMMGIGRIVVQDQMTLAENGYFGIGARFGTLVVVLASVFTMVWQDIAFSRGTNASSNFYGRAASFYVSFISFGLALLLAVLGPVFPLLIGRAFSPVFSTLPSFLIVAGLGAYSTFLGNTFYALNRTAPVLYSTLAGTATTVALTYPLVALWGILGANISVGAGFAVVIGIRVLLLRRSVEFNFRTADLVCSVLVLTLGTAVFFLDVFVMSVLLLLAVAGAFLLLNRVELIQLFSRPTR